MIEKQNPGGNWQSVIKIGLQLSSEQQRQDG
jgi:hypothetical protein